MDERSSPSGVAAENEFLICIRNSGYGGPGLSIGQEWEPRPSDLLFPPTLRDNATGDKFSADLIAYAGDVPTSVTYTARVPSGQWEAVATFDGVKTTELLNDVMVVCEKPTVPEGETYTRFDVMHNIDREKYAMRMTARLKNGKTEEVDFHDGVLTGSPAKGFALIQGSEQWKAEDVAQYVIERSPILVGTIKNIALAPISSTR